MNTEERSDGGGEVPVEPPVLSDPIEEPHLHLAPPTSFASLVEDAMVEPLHPDRSAPKSTTTSTEDRAARSRARRSARGGSISVAARTSAVYTAALTSGIAYQSKHDASAAAAATIPPTVMTQAEQDALAKASGQRKTRMSIATTPGAVMAANPVPVAPAAAAAAPNISPAGGMTQAEQDALAKDRGHRPMSMSTAKTPGAVMVAPNDVPPAAMSRAELRRYDAKMAKMNQSHEDSREKRGTTGTSPVEPSLVVPPSETRTRENFSQMSEEERQRHYDAKMDQMDQRFAESREKRGGDEEQPQRLAAPQPQDSGVSFKSLKTKDESSSAHAISPGITTTADRGVAVAPDVENGEYAVAVAVDEEEEEDKNIIYAVEYDPDTKPSILQNRRFRYYAMGGFVVAVIAAVLVIVAVVKGTDKKVTIFLTAPPTDTPTAAPTTARESSFLNIFAQEVSEKVREPGTPHWHAAQWIMNDDPLRMDVDDSTNLIQRYMMAFLYFHSTNNGENPWISCNPPVGEEDDTCTLLMFSRLSDDSDAYTPIEGKVRWLSGQGVCEWEGVLCAGGDNVLGVSLYGQNLTGTLPSELKSLNFLQQISLGYNLLTGTIPPEWSDLNHLLKIDLQGNLLEDTIPESFYEEDKLSLVSFNIGDNLLHGQLDTRIGTMTDLKSIFLFENNFDGPLPTEIGNLSYLAYIRINGNEFTGSIPTQLGQFIQLAEMWFHECQFTGALPTQLGRLTRLQNLRLWKNQLTGSIPEEMYNLTKLTRFSVREMALTGTLSTRVGQLTDLTQLKVSTNQLSGTIPSELQNLSKLRLAHLHLNQFVGSVPIDICNLAVPGGLEFFQADCHPIENPPNECICCSSCCNRVTKVCLSTNNK